NDPQGDSHEAALDFVPGTAGRHGAAGRLRVRAKFVRFVRFVRVALQSLLPVLTAHLPGSRRVTERASPGGAADAARSVRLPGPGPNGRGHRQGGEIRSKSAVPD